MREPGIHHLPAGARVADALAAAGGYADTADLAAASRSLNLAAAVVDGQQIVVPVLGGDTTRAAELVLSVTALGRAERTPGRGGARPGDLLVVTGPLGGKPVRPPVRVEEGVRLARHAHAMLDLSDGLGRDAGHIARRSGVRCVIELDRVPLAEGATVADLGYGEDYELLAAVEDADGFTVIGRCEEGEGVEGLGSLGGWDHFS